MGDVRHNALLLVYSVNTIVTLCVLPHIWRMRLVEIGRHLRLQRHAHGMTQQDLATRAGVTRSTVSRIESGADNDIGVKKLAALLEAVGSSLGVEPLGRPIEEDPIATIARAAGGPVFGTLYPDELVQAMTDELAGLHLIASHWYAREGRPVPAIDHAIASGDLDHALALLDRKSTRLNSSHRT